ncbi:uncharacterized protein LOC143416798 [Maylandia zebra]|uniref:uncharacterized protein LOC143416798 n=1 Tax=Maylandia zebra TaxID=106582 RepID=UPI00403D2C1F
MICRILLLIILTSCVSGSFVVNVTQTSYQADNNHDIIMEWTFTTKPEGSSKTLSIVCCHVVQHKHFVLYHVNNGVEVSKSQDKMFSGRVQSDKDALREGRIRLQLHRLRSNDSGLYVCEVKTDYGFGVGRSRLNVIRSKLENIQFYMTIALIAVIILGAVMVMIGFIVNTVARLLAENKKGDKIQCKSNHTQSSL